MAHKGLILKQSRESKGISLESVHEATKIPMDALRAIEEGYTVRTLTSFYYKGFIKMYAQYLGVDPTAVLEEVRAKDDKPKKPLPQDIKREIKRAPQFSYSNEFKLRDGLRDFMTPRRRRQILAVAGLIIGLFFLFQTVSFIGGWFRSRAAKARIEKRRQLQVRAQAKMDPQPNEREVEPAAPVVRTVASVPTASQEATTPKPAGAATSPVTLTVRAKKDSWLQVKSDGSVVFQSTLNKGDVETWNAKESLELSGKNINELDFELNGKIIGSLGRGDRGARKIYITHDGLTVKK